MANEIRKLAEQSTNFAEEINLIINELKNSTDEAVTTVEKVNSIVEEQTGCIQYREKFNMIAAAIENTRNNLVDRINQKKK